MTQLLESLYSLISPLWEMSLTAAFVAVVVFLLRLILKQRAPRQLICLLWLIVFARLLIPISLQSPVSLVPDMDSTDPAPVVTEAPVATAAPAPSQPIAQAPPVPSGIISYPDPAETPVVQDPVASAPVLVAPVPVITAPVTEETPPAVEETPFPWKALVAGLWALGVAAMLAYGTISYVKVRRSVRFAIRGEDGVWEDSSLRSPFILGLFRPKIYLPSGLNDYVRHFILCHEQAHIRRRDYLVKPICWLALAIHWFNPAAWIAFLLMSRDMEVACDESVLRHLGSEVKADYSATLLALATNGRFPAPTPLAFGEGDAKTRIKSVLNFKKPALWVTIVAIVVAVVAAVCLLTDPMEDFDPSDYTTSEYYPGLYFQIETDEETGDITTMAYHLVDDKPELVAGWVNYIANNFTGLIHPDGEEEVTFSREVIAQYEQYLVNAMEELDPNWVENCLMRDFAILSPLSNDDGSVSMGVYFTPEGNLLLRRAGRTQVLELAPELSAASPIDVRLTDFDGDGDDELALLWDDVIHVASPDAIVPDTALYSGDYLMVYEWDGHTWTYNTPISDIADADPFSTLSILTFDAETGTIRVTLPTTQSSDPSVGQTFPGSTMTMEFTIPPELDQVEALAVSNGVIGQITVNEDGSWTLTRTVYAYPNGSYNAADMVPILTLSGPLHYTGGGNFDVSFNDAEVIYDQQSSAEQVYPYPRYDTPSAPMILRHTDPISADLDGDGRLETVWVTHNEIGGTQPDLLTLQDTGDSGELITLTLDSQTFPSDIVETYGLTLTPDEAAGAVQISVNGWNRPFSIPVDQRAFQPGVELSLIFRNNDSSFLWNGALYLRKTVTVGYYSDEAYGVGYFSVGEAELMFAVRYENGSFTAHFRGITARCPQVGYFPADLLSVSQTPYNEAAMTLLALDHERGRYLYQDSKTGAYLLRVGHLLTELDVLTLSDPQFAGNPDVREDGQENFILLYRTEDNITHLTGWWVEGGQLHSTEYNWHSIASQFSNSNTLVYDKDTNSLTLSWNGTTYRTGRLAQDLSEAYGLADGYSGAAHVPGVQNYRFFSPNSLVISMPTAIADKGSGANRVRINSTGATELYLCWGVYFNGSSFEVDSDPFISSTVAWEPPNDGGTLMSELTHEYCRIINGSDGNLYLSGFYNRGQMEVAGEILTLNENLARVELLRTEDGFVVVEGKNSNGRSMFIAYLTWDANRKLWTTEIPPVDGELLYEDERASFYYSSENNGQYIIRYGGYTQVLEDFHFNGLRPWCTTWEADGDGDGIDELYIVHPFGSGTGVSVDTLTVCEPAGTKLNVWYHDWSEIPSTFNGNNFIHYNSDAKLLYLVYNGQQLMTGISEDYLRQQDWSKFGTSAIITGEQVAYENKTGDTLTIAFMPALSDGSPVVNYFRASVCYTLRFTGDGFELLDGGTLQDNSSDGSVYDAAVIASLSNPEAAILLAAGGRPLLQFNGHLGVIDEELYPFSAGPVKLSLAATGNQNTIALVFDGSKSELHEVVPVTWSETDQKWVAAVGSTPLVPTEIVTVLPENPDEYYLVGQLPEENISLCASNYGGKTMLVWDNFYWEFENRTAHTPHMDLPRLSMLSSNRLAVISEVNSGIGCSVEELVVYVLEEDMTVGSSHYTGVKDYVYDWKAVAEQFNRSNTLTYRADTNAITLTYGSLTYDTGPLMHDLTTALGLGQTFTGAAIVEGDLVSIQENADGTFTITMPATLASSGEGHFSDEYNTWVSDADQFFPMADGTIGISLVWAVRFTGSGFEELAHNVRVTAAPGNVYRSAEGNYVLHARGHSANLPNEYQNGTDYKVLSVSESAQYAPADDDGYPGIYVQYTTETGLQVLFMNWSDADNGWVGIPVYQTLLSTENGAALIRQNSQYVLLLEGAYYPISHLVPGEFKWQALHYADMDDDGQKEVGILHSGNTHGAENPLLTIFELENSRLKAYTYDTADIVEIFLGSSIVAYSRSTGYLTLNHFYYADEGETMILTEGGGPLDISYFKGYEDQIDRFAYGYTSQVWGVSWTGSHIEIVLRPTLADDVMPLVRDPNSDFEYDLSVKPNLYIDGRSVGTVTYPLIYTGSGFTVGEPGIRITYTP